MSSLPQIELEQENITHSFANILNQLKQFHQGMLSHQLVQNNGDNHYDNGQDNGEWVDESDYNGEMGDYLSSQASQKMQQEDLQMIPLVTYDNVKDKFQQGDSCSICFRIYEDTQELNIRDLPCHHLFHQECLDPWLLDKPNCPLCKLNIKQTL